MVVLRALLGFVRLFLFACTAISIYSALLLVNLFYKDDDLKVERGLKYRRSIIRVIHKILGTKVTVYGKESLQSGLIVFNHRSYFDPILILKNKLAFPVGKKEVESWPLIGNVAKTTGVIFVNREHKESRKKTLKKMKVILEKGYSILIAPEGTTHIEPTTIDFRPGAFVLAAQLGIPVIPIAIDYKLLSDAWIGNDTFLPHFIRCFGKWNTEIKMSFLKPIPISDNVDELITLSKKCIDDEMLRFRKDWNNEL